MTSRGIFYACFKGSTCIHHHRGTPLFSVCRPTPRSQSKKSYGVYHFPGKTREKGIHHRSGKKGIHHRASDPEKEKKEGLHGGGVYFFLQNGGVSHRCACLKLSTRGFSHHFGAVPTTLKKTRAIWGIAARAS